LDLEGGDGSPHQIERLLDEERRTLIRKNEDRLERYVNAAAP